MLDVDSQERDQIGPLLFGRAFVLPVSGKRMKSVLLLICLLIFTSLGSNESGGGDGEGDTSTNDDGQKEDQNKEEQGEESSGGDTSGSGGDSEVPESPSIPQCSPAPTTTATDCQCGTETCNNRSMCLSGPPMSCHKVVPPCLEAPTGAPKAGCFCDLGGGVCDEGDMCFTISDGIHCSTPPPLCPPLPAMAGAEGCFCNSTSRAILCSEGRVCDRVATSCPLLPPTCPPSPWLAGFPGCFCLQAGAICREGKMCNKREESCSFPATCPAPSDLARENSGLILISRQSPTSTTTTTTTTTTSTTTTTTTTTTKKDSDAGNGDSGSTDEGGSSDGRRRKRSSEGDFVEEDTIRLACEEGFLFNSSSIESDGVVEVPTEDQETEISMKGNGDANTIVKPNGEKEVEIECLHTSEWSATPTCYLVQVGFECFITRFLIFVSVKSLTGCQTM